MKQYYIIRTSWLYSSIQKEFFKDYLKLSNTQNSINVVSDQIGSPTYAMDLAKVIIELILHNNIEFGIYHYSNKGSHG